MVGGAGGGAAKQLPATKTPGIAATAIVMSRIVWAGIVESDAVLFLPRPVFCTAIAID